MDISILKKWITSDFQDDVDRYLYENYYAITRKKQGYKIHEPEDARFIVLRHFIKHNSEFSDFIDSQFLTGSIEEKLFRLVNNIVSVECEFGETKRYIAKKKKYGVCRVGCACFKKIIEKTPEEQNKIVEKRSNTNLIRYGTACSLNNETVRKKTIRTMLERYGVENSSQNIHVRNRAKKTLLDRYGVDHYSETLEFKETMSQRWADRSPSDLKAIRDKTSDTSMERYGVTCSLQNDEIKKKSSETFMLKFGVDHPARSAEVREKTKLTNIDRYGVDNPARSHITNETRLLLENSEELQSAISRYSIRELSDMWGVSTTTISTRCKSFGICLPKSTYETAISSFLEEIDIRYIHQTRSVIPPKELDFYIPDYKIAIEFNGLYYHSEAVVGKNYHKEKWLSCDNLGIQLLMINEDEWLRNPDSFKNKIMNMCGKSERGPGARSISILPIDTSAASDFVQKYHIQGRPHAVSVAYGGFLDNMLVGVITFGKQRGTQRVELTRFCTNGKIFAGLFSKLFSRAVREHKFTEVITFSDLRYSNGNLYNKTGFVIEKYIPPDYRYFKNLKTYHKSSFTKTNIQKKFNIDVENNTEKNLMEELGFSRIYDCGKIRYLWKRPL